MPAPGRRRVTNCMSLTFTEGLLAIALLVGGVVVVIAICGFLAGVLDGVRHDWRNLLGDGPLSQGDAIRVHGLACLLSWTLWLVAAGGVVVTLAYPAWFPWYGALGVAILGSWAARGVRCAGRRRLERSVASGGASSDL